MATTKFACTIFGPKHGKASSNLTGASFSEVPAKEAACSRWCCPKMDGSTSLIKNHCVAAYGTVNLICHLDTDFAWINYKSVLFNPMNFVIFMLPKYNLPYPDRTTVFSSPTLAWGMELWVFSVLPVSSIFSDITSHLVDSTD